MNLKNYTTKIPAYQTIAEIEKALLNAGARGIMKEYDNDGRVEMLVFTIRTEHGDMGFRLPCEFKKIREYLKQLKTKRKLDRVSWKQLEEYNHSQNVGWRILKDWIEVQVSLIKVDLVSLDQIFLPYAYNPLTKKTFYESLEEDGFKYLLGEGK